ncbi:hypothetical protein [Pseudomonas veronii]|uniref:hypothetical protein n=1 Tax=Pseudomonas veronii TaxID=76761 RepID=UPI00143D7A37|nr:hypothetical protein [Pseudomonas veronii]
MSPNDPSPWRTLVKDDSLLASLLKRMNENQLALGAAIEELSNWVEQRGSTEVALNIRGALDTLDVNAGFINLALASLAAEGRTKK